MKPNYHPRPAIYYLLLTICYLLSTTPAIAADPCSPIYGGGETCKQSQEISIQKTIKNSQSKYTTNQNLTFQITIRNNTKNLLTNIVVRDLFPQPYLNFVTGPGQFDQKNGILTFVIAKLNPEETKSFSIEGKINNQIPTNQKLLCIVNQANVTHNKQTSQTHTPFCIQPTTPNTTNKLSLQPTPYNLPPTTKGGLPIYQATSTKQTPATGPETLALIPLLPAGALGYYLRRKTK